MVPRNTAKPAQISSLFYFKNISIPHGTSVPSIFFALNMPQLKIVQDFYIQTVGVSTQI